MNQVLRHISLLCLFVLSGITLSAQCGSCVNNCPTNEADLANGGTFCGTCTVAVGGSVTITGKVIWCSGTLNITGNDGDIILEDTLEIYGGTVQATDNNDGSLDVQNDAYVFVANGSTLSIDDEIDVNSGGNIVIEGDVTSNSDIFIDAGAQATVNSTGHLSTTGGDDDIFIGGTMTVNGGEIDCDDLSVSVGGSLSTVGANLDIRNDFDIFGSWTDSISDVDVADDVQIDGTVSITGTDFDVTDNFVVDGSYTSTGVDLDVGDDITIDGTWTSSGGNVSTVDLNITGTVTTSDTITASDDIDVIGGTLNLTSGASATAGDDIKVYNGGIFNLFQGATAGATNNIVNSSNGNVGGNTQGSFNICDTLTAGGNLTIANTAPNSSLCGCASGVLIVSGTFSHTETPQCDFFGCAGGGVPCAPSVLPVTWLSFHAEEEVNAVHLKWSTASELNNLGFEVQRATNGLNFETIGFVEGAGNSKLNRYYSFLDEEPISGSTFYRLMQQDWDGKSDYSVVLVVETDERKSEMMAYPNPSKGSLHLLNSPEEILSISAQDIQGRVYPLQFDSKDSANPIISTESLSSGIYFLLVNHSSGQSVMKIVIE